MRGYDRQEEEYYDDYEEEGEEQGGEEEEYEEEEERKPTVEEMEYLQLRERIKEQIRKKMQKENGSVLSKSQEKNKKFPSDNFGSFFGPSKPVIAQRVIQESKSLLENQHLALRVPNSQQNKKSSSSTAASSKNGVHASLPKVKNQQKTKLQKLKDTRDYSFLLSDDAELPAPAKEPAPRHISAPISEARLAQLSHKSKQPSSNSGRNIHGGREERKPVSMNGRTHTKVGPHKPLTAKKPNPTLIDPRRQIGSNNGFGPGRPSGPKGLPSKPNGLLSKTPVSIMDKKASMPSAKKIPPATQRPASSKIQSSVQKQHLEQRKGLQEPNKPKMTAKQPLASSKPQLIKKPIKQVSSHASSQDNRPKKKPARPFPDEFSDEEEDALAMIRKMFGNKRYANCDDDDDSDMEANFDDIMEEEERSARIARREDEEQLRLIEEEERQELMRKQAKKRKLSQR